MVRNVGQPGCLPRISENPKMDRSTINLKSDWWNTTQFHVGEEPGLPWPICTSHSSTLDQDPSNWDSAHTRKFESSKTSHYPKQYGHRYSPMLIGPSPFYASSKIDSLAFAERRYVGSWIKKPGITGKALASTTRSPLVPMTLNLESSTVPIGAVQHA